MEWKIEESWVINHSKHIYWWYLFSIAIESCCQKFKFLTILTFMINNITLMQITAWSCCCCWTGPNGMGRVDIEKNYCRILTLNFLMLYEHIILWCLKGLKKSIWCYNVKQFGIILDMVHVDFLAISMGTK